VLRYFALATVIVLTVVVFATAWENRELIRIRIASTSVPMSPKPADPYGVTGRANVPVRGDAPWALSALPECLEPTSVTTGPLAYVLAHLPPGATPVVPPATLSYGDCTILLSGDEAYVRRGNDRFHIPAHVRFYRGPALLAVLRLRGNDNELRVYLPAQP
jgi:hypothetical protein